MGRTLDDLLERYMVVDGQWGQGASTATRGMGSSTMGPWGHATSSANSSSTPNSSQSTLFERLQQDVVASSTFITPKVGVCWGGG